MVGNSVAVRVALVVDLGLRLAHEDGDLEDAEAQQQAPPLHVRDAKVLQEKESCFSAVLGAATRERLKTFPSQLWTFKYRAAHHSLHSQIAG